MYYGFLLMEDQIESRLYDLRLQNKSSEKMF